MKKISIFDKPKYLAPLDTEELENEEDDFRVLTDRESVRFFVKDICNLMHHPVTLLDINRIEAASDEEIRIDSNVEYFTHRSACQVFRRCAGPEHCFACDKYHALIFKNYLQNGTPLPSAGYPQFFSDTYPQNTLRILKRSGRDVLEYNCPMLGYRELMFPVYYEKDLIGIMILGQSMVNGEGDESKIEEISDSFFSKSENCPENLFYNFCEKYRSWYGEEITPEELVETIKNADSVTEKIDRLLNVPMLGENDTKEETRMTFKDMTSFENYIDAVCEELKNYEANLFQSYQRKMEKHINDISEEIVEEFYTKSRSFKSSYASDRFGQRREEVEHEWELFYDAAEEIKNVLGLDEIFLFGDGASISVIENPVKPLYRPQNKKEPGVEANLTYDFSIANDIIHTTYDFISSMDYPELLDGVCKEMQGMRRDMIVLVCSETAVTIKISDFAAQEKKYSAMAETIGKNISKICLSIALCKANLTKERHVLTLRMNRHESVHIASKLRDNMSRYFSQGGQTYLKLDREKQANVVEDLSNTIRLISHMSQNIGVITGAAQTEIVTKKNRLDVFDMLFKWQIMFRDKLQDRNIDLVIVRKQDPFYIWDGTVQPDAPRYILINSDFFELLVYNLVDNAVKYAHRGSKIFLNWCEMYEGQSHFYRLSVSSLGPEIEAETDIYELYVRGKRREKTSADGDGIGLYVVKRISDLLGLKVAHSSKQLSPYHVPLIDWFIQLKSGQPDKYGELVGTLRAYREGEEYHRMTKWLNDHEYTSIRRRDITHEYLEKRITLASCENVFWVDVPAEI